MENEKKMYLTAEEVLGGIAPKANKMEQAKRILRELAETHFWRLQGCKNYRH